eukprot:5665496-Prymnesium_polylepis.1
MSAMMSPMMSAHAIRHRRPRVGAVRVGRHVGVRPAAEEEVDGGGDLDPPEGVDHQRDVVRGREAVDAQQRPALHAP